MLIHDLKICRNCQVAGKYIDTIFFIKNITKLTTPSFARKIVQTATKENACVDAITKQ